MAPRSRTSFQKRQKEILRMERQKEKAAKRMERKLVHKDGDAPDTAQIDEQGNAVDDQGTAFEPAPTTTD
jgi:hypothetical protein